MELPHIVVSCASAHFLFKRPCTAFQGATISASIQTYGTLIPMRAKIASYTLYLSRTHYVVIQYVLLPTYMYIIYMWHSTYYTAMYLWFCVNYFTLCVSLFHPLSPSLPLSLQSGVLHHPHCRICYPLFTVSCRSSNPSKASANATCSQRHVHWNPFLHLSCHGDTLETKTGISR